jgi:hypothetical protein
MLPDADASPPDPSTASPHVPSFTAPSPPTVLQMPLSVVPPRLEQQKVAIRRAGGVLQLEQGPRRTYP